MCNRNQRLRLSRVLQGYFVVRTHRSESPELLTYSVIDLHCGLRSFCLVISLPTETEYFPN